MAYSLLKQLLIVRGTVPIENALGTTYAHFFFFFFLN